MIILQDPNIYKHKDTLKQNDTVIIHITGLITYPTSFPKQVDCLLGKNSNAKCESIATIHLQTINTSYLQASWWDLVQNDPQQDLLNIS